jgi:hypothetical protein
MLYNKQYKWQDDLIHQVGLTFFKKDWVIKEIVYHPLKFAKRRMEDPTDDRPIRIRYFAAFVLKSTKTKERVNRFRVTYRSYEKCKDVAATHGVRIDTEEHYQDDMQSLAIRNRWVVLDDIYNKSSVMNDQQPILKHLLKQTV